MQRKSILFAGLFNLNFGVAGRSTKPLATSCTRLQPMGLVSAHWVGLPTVISYTYSVAVSCGKDTCFAVGTCDGLYHFVFSIDRVGIPLGVQTIKFRESLVIRLYSEIDQIHLSIEAQCVTTLLPLGGCHIDLVD